MCPHMPTRALEQLGTTDVFIFMDERGPVLPGSDHGFTKQPDDFEKLLSGVDERTDVFQCVDAAEREDFGLLKWLSLEENDRGYYLIVAAGRDASDRTLKELAESLNSLHVAKAEE